MTALSPAAAVTVPPIWKALVAPVPPVRSTPFCVRSPAAVVFVVVSPLAATLSDRLGQRAVSATGLFIAAAGFGIFLTVTPGSSFWLFLATSLVLGLGIALAMTPATNAIVASLPPEKQGVASAINDLGRELGSAFGVAIIGSAFNTGYRNSIDQHLTGLPDQVAHLAHQAPATAYAAAAKLPGVGHALVAHTNDAFVAGLHAALVISGAAMLLGAVYVATRAPSRAEAAAEDVLDHPELEGLDLELDLDAHLEPRSPTRFIIETADERV